MYVLIAGGGKVGANVARTLLRIGHEVTLIESTIDRYERLEPEFEHQVIRGDATEISTLERGGIGRPPDLVLAVTGDDEDNLVICQLAQKKYGVEKVIARVNDPRNQEHFDLLGIAPTVCATSSILGLVEHEVPAHGLIPLLELKRDNLEIVEIPVTRGGPADGQTVDRLKLPIGASVIAVLRAGNAEPATPGLKLVAGDQMLAIVKPGRIDELRKALALT
jgi:trk system potassium uptake protein TrkA